MKDVRLAGMLFLLLSTGWSLGHQGHHHPPKVSESMTKEAQRQAYYEARLKKNPNDLFAMGRLGELYLARARQTTAHGDFLKAETYFETMLTLFPESLDGMRGLAACLSGRHQFRQALVLARQFAERQPKEVDAWVLLGDTHFALGNYLEGEILFERVLANKRDLVGLTRMAQVAEIRGDLEKAETLYHEAVLSLDSNDQAAHAWCLTMIAELELQRGAVRAAHQRFQTALTMIPELHYAHWRLAQMALQANQPKRAEQAIRRALMYAPEHPGYQFTQARIAARLGETAKARAIRDHAIHAIEKAVAAGDFGHSREWVKELLHTGNHLEKALELASMEVTRVRQDWEGHELHAWLLHLNGCRDEALAAMRQALAPGGCNPTTLLRAGIIYAEAGVSIKALLFLDRGLSAGAVLDPSLEALAKQTQASLLAKPLFAGQSRITQSQVD